ncbi:MAG: 50S ribosomal protein L17 [Tannerella sp.]|jgi:large subunit ribosomal protein L17|nr:50S ribosomal protein L17 [Tannerella sp.]
MRHNKKINHLGRTKAHREAMLANMASSLIMHKRIFTTTAKAKALRKYVEPLITKSKEAYNKTQEESTHSRRTVFASLQNKHAVAELFGGVAEKIGDRPGGYTRIIKTGNRLGDNAAMCFIELVDFNDNMMKDTKKATTKTRRSRSRSKSADATTAVAAETKTQEKAPKEVKAETVQETPVEEMETENAVTIDETEATENEETSENKEEKAAE